MLNKLREKPERAKKQIAFSVAFCVTFCIFAVWFATFYQRVVNKNDAEFTANQKASPISIFKDDFSTFFDSLSFYK
jgi:heme/copper-type cytochrome/quinol oxidase subunit 3